MTDKNSQDLTQMSAQALTVKIGENDYKVSRPTIDDFGALEMIIKQDRMVMLSNALKASGEDRDFVASKMIEMINSPLGHDAFQEGLKSVKYLTEFLFICLKKHNPDIEKSVLFEDMSQEDLANITTILMSAGQEKNAKRVKPKPRAK